MLSRHSVPRIRVDLPDSSSRSLSPSSTLDIRDILNQVKSLPKLLAEDIVFNDAADALHLEDGRLQDVPPFPTGRQPPLFILNSHRARLPFPIRPEAFELGDFCRDEEDACPLLTAPTVPRMKYMIREQLYVQKWVDTLTSENPPKHIPWTCERPAAERKWIAEGSIFPAAVVESSHEQRKAAKEHTDTSRSLALADQVSYSGESGPLPEAPVPIHPSTECHTSASHTLAKSAEVDPTILRGELKTTQTPYRTTKASQVPSSPTLAPPGLPSRMTSPPDAPLAARRGKLLSGLKLKGSVIEQLEYPDIPTAFRGSPGVWSPRFDAFPIPCFTDHQSMLRDLKLKCAALGSAGSTYIQESLHPRTEMMRTSLSMNEWWFARGLATFDDDLSGSIDSQVPGEIIADTRVFLPEDSSTPVKGPGFTARLGFASRFHSSTPAPQSSVNRCSDPPKDPLPPRPALISPSTPPHVRGILKKAKSVRFEDMVTKESPSQASPVVPPVQTFPERPSSSLSVISSERSRAPVPDTPNPSSGAAPINEMLTLEKNLNFEEKKPAPRSRLPPKRPKANGRIEPIRPNAGKMPETFIPTSATTSAGRPCRTAHVKENTTPATAPQTHAKQKGLSIHELDIRRGIEGTTKSRLSTPLRNIFRFR